MTEQKVRKELKTEMPSIYSFELHEMKEWLKEQGEKPSAQPKFSSGFMRNV